MNMNNQKLKSAVKKIIMEILSEEGVYPTSTVQISTLNGTTVLLYNGDVSDKDNAVNDVNFKTPTKFKDILRNVRELKSKESSGEKIGLDKFMTSDKDVISVLLNLTDDELNKLETEKLVVTNNIPNEILDLTGKNIPTQNDTVNEYKKKNLIKFLKKIKKESGDPFRDIVKKYAHLYRDSELSRMDKEKYNKWLQSKASSKDKNIVSKATKK